MRTDRAAWVDISVLMFGASLMALAVIALWSRYPVGTLLFGWVDHLDLRPIGQATQLQGNVRRKPVSQSDFASIQNKSTLYNYDTLVTDGDSQTVVQLDDGGIIELGPRTMVKLVFETRVDWTRPLQALQRQARVEVISGAATSKNKKVPITLVTPQRNKNQRIQTDRSTLEAVRPIEIAPAPILVQPPAPPIIKPEPKPLPPMPAKPIDIKVSASNYGSAIKFSPLHTTTITVAAQWTVNSPLVFDVRLIEKATGKVIFTKSLASGIQQIKTSVKRPGIYEWTFTHKKRLLARTPVNIPKRIEGGILILEPLISGQKTRSTEYTGVHLKHFDLTLRWKLETDADLGPLAYTIYFYTDPRQKPFLTGMTHSRDYVLTHSKASKGRLFYRVTAKTPEGFALESPLVPFQFDYVPPIPVNPPAGKGLSREELAINEGRILFTWKKTNFTEHYELEISEDLEFERILHKLNTSENFFTFGDLKPGRYWWRVRSFANGVHSPATPGSEFTLKP